MYKIPRPFKPTWESVKSHTLPAWYDDVKLGIFVHWGPYSVPSFAPATCELGDIPLDEEWFCNNPYAEWYLNSIRTKKGPSYTHHLKTYGSSFPYENFVDMWTAEKWDPEAWASLFKEAGAGYVVLTTKHHDGFCLWPSKYTDYNAREKGPKRDLMGELAGAVRAADMKIGAYYSGIFDWTVPSEPLLNNDELFTLAPTTFAYADYAADQVRELIDLYHPSVFWNDIGWPEKGIEDLKYLFAHYYNTVEDGVVDDRWNDTWSDFTSKEYGLGEVDLNKKWEMCRGLGYSFGYNQEEGDQSTISSHDLIALLVSTVSRNGNLLINVGPRADGTIPEEQAERLRDMGAWLKINGEAIFGTRPYRIQQEKTREGVEVWYTKKDTSLYLLLDNLKPGKNTIHISKLTSVSKTARNLDENIICKFEDYSEGLKIVLDHYQSKNHIVAIEIKSCI